MPYLNEQRKVEALYLENFSNGLNNKIKNVLFVNKLDTGILHITGEVYYTGILSKGPLIVTIHDMGSLQKGNFLKKTLVWLFWFKIISMKASAITVISEFTKSQLLNHVKINPKKIKVIHNPISPRFKFKPKYEIAETPIILHLGTKPNKNLMRLLIAIKDLSCELRIVGKIPTNEQNFINDNQIRIKNFIGLSFQEIIELYEECDIVSFISTYEGFGMPVIEAQAVGRPVITSNVSSIPEIAGEGALFVDPNSVEEIRNGISQIISNKDLRRKLIERGENNVKRFKIDSIANKYIQLYDEVLKNG